MEKNDLSMPSGQPYYPPQQEDGGPYCAPSPSGQQQQVVIMGTQPTTVFVNQPPVVSMVGAIVLSCIVYWIFGCLFGGIAFILAMVGQSTAAAGDRKGAIQLRNASYGVSIAGIFVCVIAIAVCIGLYFTAVNRLASKTTYCRTYGSSGYYYYSC